VVNDREVFARMQKFAEEQIGSGHAVKAADLVAQLDRGMCEVKLAPAGAGAIPLPELAAQRRAAVGVIGGLFKCKKCTNWHVSAASGFFIGASGVFVTCHHVIKSADRETFVVLTGDGRLAAVREVLAADAAADVAIVACEGEGFTAAPLAADAPVGSPVTVFGHPNDHFFSLTQGIISRYFIEARPRKTEMLSITADFAKGSSGAPVFDAGGNVIGMVANTQSVYYDEKDGHAENLQMVFKNCVTAKSILRLIKPAAN
jgi:serine protease Do